MAMPTIRPANPCFSSGPCAKRPGWSAAALDGSLLGRSHRSTEGRARLAEVIDRTRAVLGIPADWRVGIVPASDTGAVEMALWSLLGPRPIDMLAWESFGATWVADVLKQLKLPDVRVLEADYGALPDLGRVDFSRDVVFTWNGTTSGARVPNGDWIADDRQGLTICDATSAAFAMDLPWRKLDVVTWSWQKVLGGEGQHGMLVLSPRAVERLESHKPAWPMPKIFRMTSGGKLMEGIFKGDTINTPSMLCAEDAIDGLRWAESVGGLSGLIARSEANLAAVADWVAAKGTARFLAEDPAVRSCTAICLRLTNPAFAAQTDGGAKAAARVAALLAKEGVGYDLASYRDAPPGLRIWGGATVERSNIEALLPWIDWAVAEVARDLA
ncbi:phosphoserine transaminase [Rhodospirillum rubrum]|uniref:phosphoserine transaminase n=1 Tax=Rhodospirillum rubrum (strain ATCC 11170 / ATH 1.1.1 / DSM 467 / LMG 4362 / NCIMB 8255 / S1) TaxID=269796 RepID=Q2RVE0_RHORT|nr:phosphoserine transaminase [Rhodospirillum rubrum]ABC21905.1 phosphoserine aminotransferase [Rhodospirillum rubrum ATCC 11170]AEO47607.1 phosphoserine aminotransferase [Rhodospirillum rubrum F11]MBK5953468.1 phosphoserine aminotransferase [Rhodospirillum rubrum]QXG81563.1 phosphoserine transaminase [Rhodospirillum rubrum]HAP99548.1 phosphoserine transaminase [Rhodospirillum rubrum]